MLFPQKTGNKLKRPTFEYQDNRFFTAGGVLRQYGLRNTTTTMQSNTDDSIDEPV